MEQNICNCKDCSIDFEVENAASKMLFGFMKVKKDACAMWFIAINVFFNNKNNCSRGLNVIQIAANNEFECIRDNIKPIILNTSAADEHVSEVERTISVIQVRVRGQINSLPYSCYPKNMVAGLVIFAVKSLNNEVGVSSLSHEYALHTLVTGYETPNYKQLMQLAFRDYVEVPNLKGVTNTTESQTIPAIALYPSGNLQGGWRLMSLNTGKLIHRSRWTKVEPNYEIIKKVDALARSQGQSDIANNSTMIANQKGFATGNHEYMDTTRAAAVAIVHALLWMKSRKALLQLLNVLNI